MDDENKFPYKIWLHIKLEYNEATGGSLDVEKPILLYESDVRNNAIDFAELLEDYANQLSDKQQEGAT